MKTRNLELELMTIGQQNKEIFINETLGAIDSFAINSIMAFVPELNDEYKHLKFILNDGDFAHHVCYCPFPEKNWRFIPPKLGMVFFCIEKGCFIFFDGSKWVHYGSEKVSLKPSFEGARDEVEVKKKLSFFYVEADAVLNLKNAGNNVLDIIFKQNAARVFNISFDSAILWPNGTQYVITQTPNQMDHIRLTKLPETEHFLGEIVSKGYKY